MEPKHARTTVVVLDRHALFRRGVVGLLKDAHPDWECSDADSLDAARTAFQTETPVVVLVDLNHPDLHGDDSLANLIASHPDHLFVGLSDDNDRVSVMNCLTLGARGYVLRATNTTQFVRALDTIVDGGVYAPVVLTAAAPPREREVVDVASATPLATLTDRQRDVFNLLAEGCATKTIARRLDLAVGTVKVHLAAIYRALGANTRLEAVAKAHRIYVMG